MAIQASSSLAIPAVVSIARQWGMGLGDKMRAAREAAQKTQDQVADHLNLTKGAVSQWETGKTVPELEYFQAFCLYIGASADEILLERRMDPLLRQLVNIWDRLSPDGRDTLLGNANRILSEEQPEAGDHNPFGSTQLPKPNRSRNGQKPVKKARD